MTINPQYCLTTTFRDFYIPEKSFQYRIRIEIFLFICYFYTSTSRNLIKDIILIILQYL